MTIATPIPTLKYERAFTSPLQATRAGYISKSIWKTKRRIVLDDAIPSFVVLETMKGHGAVLCEHDVVLEDLGNNHFRIAKKGFPVYRLDQTTPKESKPKKPKTPKPTKPTTKRPAKKPAKPPAFYIPTNYSPETFPEQQRDYAHYFLNLIHWRTINWQADDRGFVHLKHDYLTKVIPKAIWYGIRERLVAEGIVDWDETYRQGHKCFGFKLTDNYRKTRRVFCSDPVVAKAIQRLDRDRDKKLLPVHRWLRSKLNQLELDLDRAKAIISKLEPDWRSPMTTEAYREQITESCQKVAENEFYFAVDQYGRVHTPVTSLPKELRCCLSVNGQKLVGLDLANSQPLIAGIAARQFFRSKQMKHRLLTRTYDERTNPYCHRELSNLERLAEEIIHANQSAHSSNTAAEHSTTSILPITTYTKSEDIAGKDGYGNRQVLPPGGREDLERFIRLCEEGHLYEHLMEPGESRDWFKRSIYQDVFFGKNSFQSQLKRRFKQQFPSISEMLTTLKRKDHRQSAWLLQNYEATIFIYSIARRLMEERPDLVVYTIHDSFLFLPDEMNLIRSVISDEFAKLGIRPTLRDEVYK